MVRQGMHSRKPCLLPYCPLGQSCGTLVAVVGHCLAIGQGVHEARPLKSEYVPGLQGVHELLPEEA